MQAIIYLFYKTDEWHTRNSKELIYIGEDFRPIAHFAG